MSEKQAQSKAVEMNVATVVVGGLVDKYQNLLRLSELGAKPVGNGAKFQLPVDAAVALCRRHPSHLKIEGTTAHSVPTQKVSWPEGKSYEILAAGKIPPKPEKKAPSVSRSTDPTAMLQRQTKPASTEKAKPEAAAPGKAVAKDMAKSAKSEEK